MVKDDPKKTLELDRIFKLVSEALRSDRALVSLKREDAKEVRDHMLDGRKPSSVNRYLNVVRAVVNHAIREYDLAGSANPFMNLEAAPKDKAEPDRDKRRPFTAEELKDTTARILVLANPALQRIWQMLEGTGCRPAEVAGLRVSDVHLDHVIPHMTVEWHDDRRIKNAVSRRRVPLLGTALDAAKAVVKAAGGSAMLFPAYGRPNGASSASAAQSHYALPSPPYEGPLSAGWCLKGGSRHRAWSLVGERRRGLWSWTRRHAGGSPAGAQSCPGADWQKPIGPVLCPMGAV